MGFNGEKETDILYSNPQLSPEEREAECQRLKEESDKLTKWPEIN